MIDSCVSCPATIIDRLRRSLVSRRRVTHIVKIRQSHDATSLMTRPPGRRSLGCRTGPLESSSRARPSPPRPPRPRRRPPTSTLRVPGEGIGQISSGCGVAPPRLATVVPRCAVRRRRGALLGPQEGAVRALGLSAAAPLQLEGGRRGGLRSAVRRVGPSLPRRLRLG